MKLANIKWYNDKICQNVILETIEDVNQYSKLATQNGINHITRLIKENVPFTRWDHYTNSGMWGSSFGSALIEAITTGGNPIFKIDKHHNEKMLRFINHISAGEKIVINQKGGYCTFHDNIHEIISTTEFTYTSPRYYKINSNTKYINLENDPELEIHTKNYLKPLDSNFSYVCHLHLYNQYELIDIFKEFISNGGEIVYVYTTGTNIVQMHEYTKAIVKSGLKNIEFDLNAGYTDEHKSLVESLTKSGVTVKILNSKE